MSIHKKLKETSKMKKKLKPNENLEKLKKYFIYEINKQPNTK